MTARDWNRRHCARHKHATFAPVGTGDEARLSERLHIETPQGGAWRCLRCGDYVLGEPAASSAIAQAPEVLRGRALRDHFILRLLAAERIVRGVVIFGIAYAVWKFANSQNAIQLWFNKELTVFKPLADNLGYDLDHATVIDRIRKTFTYTPKSVHVAAAALAAYALLETVEGVGLWLAKRWGEYLTVVGTSIFLPIEIWDGVHKIQEGKNWYLAACTFVINVAAVVYLLVTKRLFGIRGGGLAFEAAKRADSLLTVELAACGIVPQTLGEALRAPDRTRETEAEEAAETAREAASAGVVEARTEAQIESESAER